MQRLGNDCRACRGDECHGGGNPHCVQRDLQPSILAGILDTYGGLRFIVTRHDQLKHYIRSDEFAILVPDLMVHQPIGWGDIPFVVKRIEIAVEQWIMRGVPNEPHAREARTMYLLRQQELNRGSLDLSAICET